jgi:hypothetical protein
MMSCGNSFSGERSNLEPWLTSGLLRPVQDRGSI